MSVESTSTARRPDVLLWVGIGAAVVLAVVVAVVMFSLFYGLATERACVDGEAPANDAQGGSRCFEEGTDLPTGWAWDPRGNYKE